MGNSTYEEELNKLFSLLPISSYTIYRVNDELFHLSESDQLLDNPKPVTRADMKSGFIQEDDLSKILTETNFQQFYMKYCSIEEYKIPLHNYFSKWYKSLPYEAQYPMVRLIMAFLAKNNLDKNYAYYQNCLVYYVDYINKALKTDLKKNKVMLAENLFMLLSHYVKGVTTLTVPFLVDALVKSKDAPEVKKHYARIWDDDVVDAYIGGRFFTKDDKKTTPKSVDKFLKDNLEVLCDLPLLRAEVTEYSETYYKELKKNGDESGIRFVPSLS